MSAGKWSRNTSADNRAQAEEHLHGLPPRPHTLVGREKDLEKAQALILRGAVRLVTVIGPTGVGKTRFAIELASTVASEFAEGAVFVDLAPVRDPGLVLDTIAQALGVVGLLAAGPHVKLLVTSRQPLHVRWEHRYNLLPLALPGATATSDQARLARTPATALFIERARAADPGFSAAEQHAPAIGEICRRLDGLPLAIELAAAWVGASGWMRL